VSDPAMTETYDPNTVLLTGLPLSILLLAAPLALVVSIGLLSLYRRTVFKSMRARANKPRTTEPVPPETPAAPDQPIQEKALDLAVLDHASTMTTGSAAETLYSKLLRAPWRTAAIYAIAGCCYALVMAAAFQPATETEFLPVRFLVMFWIYAWPVVLTLNLVAATTRRTKLAIASVYFLVFAALGAIAIARSPALNWGQVTVLWLIINFLPTALLWAFLNRRVRAVGPLVLSFLILALTGPQIVSSIVGRDQRLLDFVFNFGWAIGLDVNGIFIGVILLGFAVFGLVGWLTLRWIRAQYERKKISDQSITLDAIWLMFGIVQSIPLVFGGAAWILSGLVAFVVYKVITWAGFSLLKHRASSGKSPNLLLLRVFSLGKRSERLFDSLGKYWRHAGSIRLIAGPDLATTTVEPHEFLDFLSGKLARRFIDGPQTLDLRISEMDTEPDQDGRFRVNDFFCYEDTWKMVLTRLVRESDAVLMDLRGFSSKNAGAAYEIEELINVVPLERVVFVVDETTDEWYLRQIVRQSWNRMRPASPNRSSVPEQLHLFRLTGSRSGGLQQLLRVLSQATETASTTASSS
jgi:hypothetical protein